MLSTLFFFFNDTATTEIYTLSLHDALPIYFHLTASYQAEFRIKKGAVVDDWPFVLPPGEIKLGVELSDRKSTRLNSSHANISYAVFCLKKKTKNYTLKISSPYCLHTHILT